MGDLLIMSKKERQRKAILEQIEAGHLTRREASQRLSISGRQLKRILSRYRTLGDAGLIHKNRNRRSNRGATEEKKRQVLAIYQEHYAGFGPTFASEKFEELNHISIHPETLRLWLKGAGFVGSPSTSQSVSFTTSET